MKYFFNILLFSLLALGACTTAQETLPENGVFEKQKGQIEVYVCSRGCYQYLLRVDEQLYAPEPLPDAFKSDRMKVIFSGEVTADSFVVNKPGPTDIPEPDFTVSKIRITAINKE